MVSIKARLSSQSIPEERDAIRVVPNTGDVPPLPSGPVFHEPTSPAASSGALHNLTALPKMNRNSRQQQDLSLARVVGNDETLPFGLQKVDPFFQDSNGVYYQAFSKKLEKLSGKNSESINCIESFLMKSEKEWANSLRSAKLGRTKSETNLSMVSTLPPYTSRPMSTMATSDDGGESRAAVGKEMPEDFIDEFGLGKDYKPPRGLRKWMQVRLGTWPVYSLLLALGQIISANSYQIVLLTGEIGQSAGKLYATASIYLAFSISWWMSYRMLPSMYCLSLPFIFYGLAFLFIGVAHYAGTTLATGWVQNVGTGFYTIASASGGLFFALNFGDDAGGKITDWMFRACVIQGTQQVWVVALWYWGRLFTRQTAAGIDARSGDVLGTWKITAICLPIAFFLWIVGLLLWQGLPTYYRQSPGTTAAFYKSVMKRKVVVWFAVAVVLQNFFMSAPYGRNWSFLLSSEHAEAWQVLLLVVAFFIVVWSIILYTLGRLSKSHTWILPIVAIGLGAPRYAQILWGTSGVGLWLPWAGGPLASALASRAIWLWLGVLDAVQGVGIGMILLFTLTRAHVAFTIVMCQVVGSATTMLARAVAPNRLGPAAVSPDISEGLGALVRTWFWVGLIAQLIICVGFFKVYRKEQLQKP